MGMTMTQKIIAFHAGLEEVHAGQLVSARWIWYSVMTLQDLLPSRK